MNYSIRAIAAVAGLFMAYDAVAATITIPAGKITNLNWTAGNEYVLNGFCYVIAPDVLNIAAGTVVKGVPGTTSADFGCLFVTQGAQINATGTAGAPIIFTTTLDDVSNPSDISPYARGLWGGVVILGNAQINAAVSVPGDAAVPKYEVYEGLTDIVVSGQNVYRFGGNNDADNSGTFRYCSIRHGGKIFASNKEINGLSLGAVGSGTTIEYVEAYATADDGFEFFGGAVNTKYLVSAFNDDDSFDTDMGWSGKNQFWFNIQSKDARDDGGELNGQPNERNGVGDRGLVAPYTGRSWQVRNWTSVGPGNGSGGSGNVANNCRVYARHRVYNSLFSYTSNGGLNISVDSAGAACPIAPSPFSAAGTGLEYHGNLFWKTGANSAAAAVFFAAPWDNSTTVNPLFSGISYIPDYGLDPSLSAGSPALAGAVTPTADAFYTTTAYKGAFGSNDHWMDGWTYLWERGFLDISLNATYAASTDTTTVSCRSVTGVSYQFQSSSDGVTWTNVGSAVAGTGSTISTTVSPTATNLIFRVKRG